MRSRKSQKLGMVAVALVLVALVLLLLAAVALIGDAAKG
jgi:hypothetical protein